MSQSGRPNLVLDVPQKSLGTQIPEPAIMVDGSIDRTHLLLLRDLFGHFLQNAK